MGVFKRLSFSRRLRAAADNRGMALFMVLAAVAVLFTVVFEFSYVVSVNQKLAIDGVDQVKAEQLAKTGLKISLLRLKAYQNLKSAASAMGGGGVIPKGILEKVWSFPFMYPIPTEIPGMSRTQREEIEKFTKASQLEGSFTAVIESESSKLNLNSVLAPYAASPAEEKKQAANPGGRPGARGSRGQPDGAGTDGAPTEAQPFNADAARASLTEYLRATLERKFEADPDFAAEYRDFRLDDFADAVFAWADRSYQRRYVPPRELLEPKGAPFYTLDELRLIEPLDDKLFDVLAPTLTVAPTPGLNVNTMKEPVLRAIVVGIRDEEVKEFFEFRDSSEEDNLFKNEGDFFKYLQNSVSRFRGDQAEVNRFKNDLKKRGIRIVVDETAFKVTVTANVGKATRTLEAWVQTTSPSSASGSSGGGGAAPGVPAQPQAPSFPTPQTNRSGQPDPGLRITFMRLS